LYAVLKWVGVAYLLYLAWGIASADPSAKEEPGAAGGAGRPLTFWQAAVFQWVNPKAWVMAVGGISAYAAIASFPLNAVLIAGLFGGLGFGSSGAWVAFGQGLRRLLSNARALRAFNIAMALALVASLVPVVVEGWR
jgi:threonine/homoserine/homoserine lactone efflux protein